MITLKKLANKSKLEKCIIVENARSGSNDRSQGHTIIQTIIIIRPKTLIVDALRKFAQANFRLYEVDLWKKYKYSYYSHYFQRKSLTIGAVSLTQFKTSGKDKNSSPAQIYIG